jgi:hypothetical protein
MGMRILALASILAWTIFMVSLLIVGWIETAALTQPSNATSLYLYPREVKGVIRFFTEHQEAIYSVAKPSMLPSFLVTAILFGLYNSLDRRAKRRRVERILSQR